MPVRRLDPVLIDSIAAGEVIERPPALWNLSSPPAGGGARRQAATVVLGASVAGSRCRPAADFVAIASAAGAGAG